ncbi:FAD/FMN-containing dehydrogenase [Janthinobacterium sp. CG_23.3]|uniref:FAD-binding oxidoreductase n=1 Tax=Janthinobacterium sp. CG_23.3 TaxID=3349634 RepID=UPI0038D355E4
MHKDTGVEGLAGGDVVLAELSAIVGERGLLRGDDCQPYAQGARYGNGVALCVVRPATTEEVSAVVKVCVAHRVQVVVQGGNTGLVGSSTPDSSGLQIVLSLGRLRGECAVDVANRSVRLDAGVTLQELNDKLEPHGLWFPVDLGANPMIGGMIAANTGGTRLIRYGDVRHNLLALEVVLFHPAGEIVRLGSALRKDNTGYDLKQLFVGTSGVAGVITKATLEIHPRPKQSATALVVPVSDDAVAELLASLEAELGDFFSAFEGMSANAMRAAIDHVPNLRNPFAPEPIPDLAILIELESNASPAYTGLDLQETLNRFLQDKFESLISNAVIGNGKELWHLRHGISEGARSIGKPIAFDVSVPRSRVMAFRQAASAHVQANFPHLLVVDFGHIADGGVHFNVIWPHAAALAYDPAIVQQLRDDIYAMVVERFDGSYSAEHGIGPHNLAYYRKYAGARAMAMAGGIKRMLDPLALCGTVDFGQAE